MLTKDGDIPEDRLQKRVDVWETVDHRVEAVEYCLIDCAGEPHVSGLAHGGGSFCPNHVKRDVAVTVKRFPEGEAIGITATLT